MDNLRTVDWNHIRAFLVTAEAGSLSAAAQQLCLTQPTLSRQVAALEAELELILFERIGRKLALTQAGRQLLEHGRHMGDAASALTLTATGQAEAMDGTIRITASDILSSYVLPPILHQLRQIAPQLTIDLVAANDIHDLMRREADIAIRHIRPEQPDLIARQLPDGQAHFYAAT
ncbi:MAG: LysR family transcriptional regulator, partial [Tritonibacter mobilis]|nr:LysR family transcriptional regulator [Tritonibacter mobilis]